MSDLLGLIDVLARAHVAARRAGCVVLGVYGAPAGLAELVAFAGLDGVLRVEMGRQPVQREEGVGVEEEGALDDPAA
jgi:hypothetical protein